MPLGVNGELVECDVKTEVRTEARNTGQRQAKVSGPSKQAIQRGLVDNWSEMTVVARPLGWHLRQRPGRSPAPRGAVGPIAVLLTAAPCE